MIALIDETTPQINGGVLYCVVSAVLISDESAARSALSSVVPGRKRPFHWHEEGPRARAAMIAAIEEIGVIAHAVVVPCGRRSQERARRVALVAILDHLVHEGCSQLIIESRTRVDDGRDRRVILDEIAHHRSSYGFSYDWRTKTEPLLGIADAISGAMREHLVLASPDWFDLYSAVTSLTIDYKVLGLNRP